MSPSHSCVFFWGGVVLGGVKSSRNVCVVLGGWVGGWVGGEVGDVAQPLLRCCIVLGGCLLCCVGWG